MLPGTIILNELNRLLCAHWKKKKIHICVILVNILISLKIDMLSRISIAALHIPSKEFIIQKLNIKISRRINFNSQLKMKYANWRVAIDIEIWELGINNTWIVTSLIVGNCSIRCKLMGLLIKIQCRYGSLKRYKAWLMAKGYT